MEIVQRTGLGRINWRHIGMIVVVAVLILRVLGVFGFLLDDLLTGQVNLVIHVIQEIT